MSLDLDNTATDILTSVSSVEPMEALELEMPEGTSDNKINLSFKNVRVRTKTYNRGRMKITVNLSKEEAEGFVNFKKTVLPEGANESEFLKTVFFMGLEQFHNNAINMMKKYVEENEDKLRSEGVDVDALKEVGKELTSNDDATND